MVELWSSALTLTQVCEDTLVGSDQVRGISGGQRKRVTTGVQSSMHTVLTRSQAAFRSCMLTDHTVVSSAWLRRLQACPSSRSVAHLPAASVTINHDLSRLLLWWAGELLVGPKKTLFLDEISTGLDSSTTFQITRTLRDFSHLRQATMLIALLQPTPETYHLFDDILLMSEGRLGMTEVPKGVSGSFGGFQRSENHSG